MSISVIKSQTFSSNAFSSNPQEEFRRGYGVDVNKTQLAARSASLSSKRRISLLHRRNDRLSSTGCTGGSSQQRPVITRIDAAPSLSTSVPALQTLFEIYQKDGYNVVTSARNSFGSDGSDFSLNSPIPNAAVEAAPGNLSITTEYLQNSLSDCAFSSSPTSSTTTRDSTDDTLAGDRFDKLIEVQNPTLCVDALLDSLFPSLPPNTKPYHVYYNVATVDGVPIIPEFYTCPTAMCSAQFRYFKSLQTHWSEHPWNRRGILLPVTAGGIRKLSFWKHKRQFIKSLLQGPHIVSVSEEQYERPQTSHGSRQVLWDVVSRCRHGGASTNARSAVSGAVQTSDYGDISLWGPRSFLVSPRVLSSEQVCAWETARDKNLVI